MLGEDRGGGVQRGGDSEVLTSMLSGLRSECKILQRFMSFRASSICCV